MDILIHHPMFLKTVPGADHTTLTWGADQHAIPQMGDYVIQDIPFLNPPHELTSERGFGTRFLNWIRCKRLALRHMCGGLLDTQKKHIYPIDLFGEKDGGPVLVIMYCTPRCDKNSYNVMKRYADKAGGICFQDYKVACHVWLLNVYGPHGNRRLKTHVLYYGPEDEQGGDSC
jgi:hypothetical protein